MWRRLRAGTPLEVDVLALFLLVGGLACLLASLFPISDQAPIALGRACAAYGFVAGAGLLIAGPRVPRRLLHATVVVTTALIGWMLADSHTNGGLMMTAWGFAWLAVYVAVFFPPLAVRAHAALMSVACVAGIVIAAVPGTAVEAVIVVGTVWIASVALGTLSERLREQAETDHLTGVLNRNGFTKAATRELALAARTGNPLTIAIVDLDGFKTVNDEHGHAAGDRLLIELADAWQRTLRPGDLIGRFGGDEFVVLFPATSSEDADAALARLRAAHAAGWSAGVAAWAAGETLTSCLARADARLYEAKAARPLADSLASA